MTAGAPVSHHYTHKEEEEEEKGKFRIQTVSSAAADCVLE
jgi:hypothetical protein